MLTLPPGWGDNPSPTTLPPWCTGPIQCSVPTLEDAVDLGGGACLDNGVEGLWNVVDCDTPADFEAKTRVSAEEEILPGYDPVSGRTYRSYVAQLHLARMLL